MREVQRQHCRGNRDQELGPKKDAPQPERSARTWPRRLGRSQAVENVQFSRHLPLRLSPMDY